MKLDDMFSPAGIAVALECECRLYEAVNGRSVYLEAPDLQCSECGGPVNPPRRKPARWIAYNKLLFDGSARCYECLT